MHTTNHLGEYLRKIRRSRGYSQQELAIQLDITSKAYSTYETGRNFPPLHVLLHFSRFFRIPLPTLYEYAVLDCDPDSANVPYDSSVPQLIEFPLERYASYNPTPLSNEEKELLYYFSRFCAQDRIFLLKLTKFLFTLRQEALFPKK